MVNVPVTRTSRRQDRRLQSLDSTMAPALQLASRRSSGHGRAHRKHGPATFAVPAAPTIARTAFSGDHADKMFLLPKNNRVDAYKRFQPPLWCKMSCTFTLGAPPA